LLVSVSLGELLDAYRTVWYLPDPGMVELVLATVVANRLPGPPVWTLLVGPPGSGKTEVLRLHDAASLPDHDAAHDALRDVHWCTTFTEGGLLSASFSRDPAATGGLLCELGAAGVIVFPDLTTMLAKVGNRDHSALDLLREVHDGRYVRRAGSGGGRAFVWSGKAGAIGAVTEEIDRHHNLIAAMGPRFLLWRMPRLDADQRLDQGRAALAAAGREPEVRAQLTRMTGRLLSELQIPDEPLPMAADLGERLLLAVDVAAQARSAVTRDPSSREVEAVDDPEGATRMVAGLRVLHAALLVLGADEAEAWRVTTTVTWDSIPKPRRLALDALLSTRGAHPRTASLADAIGLPTPATRRALEDLAAHGLVERHAVEHHEYRWCLTEWCLDRLDVIGYVPLRSGLAVRP
jgi:hypothetical protein